MDATHRFIEQVRRKLPTHSNYAVAKALHMQQSTLNEVLKGKYGLGAKATIRIAEILGRDVRDVLVLIEEDKAKTEDDREFWGRRSPRISAAIAFAIVALGAAGISKDASAVQIPSLNLTTYTLCEVRRWLLTFLKSLNISCNSTFVSCLPF